MRNTAGGWLCSLLLLCAGTAMGQSIASNVSATEDATDAFQVESSVSASVASIVDSAATTSGSGLSGSTAALNLLAGTKSPGASPYGSPNRSMTQLELYGTRHGETRRGLKTQLLAGSGVHPRAAGSGNFSRAGVATPGTRQRETPGLPGPQSSTGEGAVSSSGGFPDSTRGTAQLSPPDPGTKSPLDWTTDGLNFELPDFSARQFLNPSLQAQIGEKRHRSGQTLPSRSRKVPGQAPSSLSTEQTLEPDILSNETLTPDILSQSPPPTIEQQIGLPQ
jgi:hypothetical protein